MTTGSYSDPFSMMFGLGGGGSGGSSPAPSKSQSGGFPFSLPSSYATPKTTTPKTTTPAPTSTSYSATNPPPGFTSQQWAQLINLSKTNPSISSLMQQYATQAKSPQPDQSWRRKMPTNTNQLLRQLSYNAGEMGMPGGYVGAVQVPAYGSTQAPVNNPDMSTYGQTPGLGEATFYRQSINGGMAPIAAMSPLGVPQGWNPGGTNTQQQLMGYLNGINGSGGSGGTVGGIDLNSIFGTGTPASGNGHYIDSAGRGWILGTNGQMQPDYATWPIKDIVNAWGNSDMRGSGMISSMAGLFGAINQHVMGQPRTTTPTPTSTGSGSGSSSGSDPLHGGPGSGGSGAGVPISLPFGM